MNPSFVADSVEFLRVGGAGVHAHHRRPDHQSRQRGRARLLRGVLPLHGAGLHAATAAQGGRGGCPASSV